MTFVKTSAFVLGFLGAVALGVLMGPSVRQHAASALTIATTPAADVTLKSASRAATERRATRRATAGEISFTPELHKRLKPLLNQGADMMIATDGFRNAEQFAAVAHAARNTDIPFMVLKHRVLNEGKTLATAIHTSKPDVDAAIEANRARAEAKSDIAGSKSDIAAVLSVAALGA